MSDFASFILFAAAWFVLQAWVFPKLGVPS
jgi:hypothetical protein